MGPSHKDTVQLDAVRVDRNPHAKRVRNLTYRQPTSGLCQSAPEHKRARTPSSSGASGRVRPKTFSSVSRNSERGQNASFGLGVEVMHGQLVVPEGVAAIRDRAGRHQAVDEDRARVSRDVPVGDLVIGRLLLLKIEPVERFPGLADLGLHHVVAAGPDQAEGFMRGGLLKVGFQTQRSRQNLAAEADVGEVRRAFQIRRAAACGCGG